MLEFHPAVPKQRSVRSHRLTSSLDCLPSVRSDDRHCLATAGKRATATGGCRPARNDRSTPSLPLFSCRRASATLAASRRQMADLAAARHLYHPSASQHLSHFFFLCESEPATHSSALESLLATGFCSATATIDSICRALLPAKGGQPAMVALPFARRPFVPFTSPQPVSPSIL